MNYAKKYFELVQKGLEKTIVTLKDEKEISVDAGLDIWANQTVAIKENTKGLVFFCGNGASATMAEHMSHDWFQHAIINTLTCAETAHLTAISNDLSYEEVFSYKIERLLSEKDMLVAISSSGNSPNIIKAIEVARSKGTFIVTLSGKKSENKIRSMGDLNFYVPLEHYGEVESAHAVLLHCALDYYLDKCMGGRH